MRLKPLQSSAPFTTAFYELTWKVNWEQCLSFGNALIHRAFWQGQQTGHPICVEMGAAPGAAPVDVTVRAKAAGCDLFAADLPREENGFLAVTGFAGAYGVDMRISIWANSNQCLFQLRRDPHISRTNDQNYYDHFADSMEIWLHVEMVRRTLQRQDGT